MKKLTLHPADAADDMQRNYRRELRRHRAKQRERITQIAIALVVVGSLYAGVTVAMNGAAHKAQLPKTAFEVAAENAKKAAVTKPKTAAKAGKPTHAAAAKKSSSAEGAPRLASGKTATKPSASPAAPSGGKTTTPRVTAASLGMRTVRIGVKAGTFDPARIELASGGPIQLQVAGAPDSASAGFRIPALDIEADNSTGTVTVQLGSPGKGTYSFTTFNGAFTGTLVIK
jgi:hypothetical protein